MAFWIWLIGLVWNLSGANQITGLRLLEKGGSQSASERALVRFISGVKARITHTEHRISDNRCDLNTIIKAITRKSVASRAVCDTKEK